MGKKKKEEKVKGVKKKKEKKKPEKMGSFKKGIRWNSCWKIIS